MRARVEDETGRLVNVRRGDHFVRRPDPAHDFDAPADCAWFRTAGGRDGLIAHARVGTPTAPRHATAVELSWEEPGRRYRPPLPEVDR